MFQPSYIKLYETGELHKRIELLNKILEDCCLCPRNCRVNRFKGEKGVCRVGALPMVSSFHAHFGEERPLVGYYGSGTIFLTYCNLKCLFCQNYDISHLGEGREISREELGSMMISLMRQGCHNINFVTPTHQAAQIVSSLPSAIENGLDIPLVYNCGGYESVETIKLLDGIIDIYMPDFKYGNNESAKKLSAAPDYVEVAKGAVKEMHRQVGDLKIDKRGIAQRGLLIRHLVLPSSLAGTREVMRFVAKEISRNTYVNIMGQYRPCYKAFEHPPMNRRITSEEFEEAVRIAREEGLWRLDGFI
ncbi:MAG TPA: radical SAM protein [Deltaproteobacteria bacterium]|nr:MAG: radical SAM protein [Deltaproteobacteria bacterium GWB2_42_7]OGP42537.1 MAG: radical SAM protein [Deltaproteobacteria bacterium GWD2_42_10]OGQ26030.1 MAG: radical SAM protein [Deltaproteobacteria bacterium RIFCSPHIGHO2_02_FULL_42_44]OGQ66047.1 MAG: radical SAM protein [Deltaproteobacteria bacterium RIFCSPLOWO2_12_FULL_42_16]OGQ72067.1 MAG: radical SAM protein [Deltaproteobacteria bacterium RIFOXYA2_FULL_42_10]HAG51791.1 radical SAM protein [Deltaproteobacteria bacterium]